MKYSIEIVVSILCLIAFIVYLLAKDEIVTRTSFALFVILAVGVLYVFLR